MKTNELTGADLNRAVALALGHKLTRMPLMDNSPSGCTIIWVMVAGGIKQYIPDYATDIAVAWPIITANKIETGWNGKEAYANMYDSGLDDAGSVIGEWPGDSWKAGGEDEDGDMIAACMRCFVSAKLGDDVNLENP